MFFSLLGATTNRKERPVGKWTECAYGGRSFNFYPVIAIDNPEYQPKVPATIKFMSSLAAHRPRHQFDLLEFHRIEPCMLFLNARVPKVTYIHQDMEVLYNKASDIRWKHAPWLYYKLEDFLMKKFDAVYVVREKAANDYKKRYPRIAEIFHFVPTWMDPKIFYHVDNEGKQQLRENLFNPKNISKDKKLLVSVGRLDRQKNPLRLIDSFRTLTENLADVHLVLIGDGVLRQQVEERIKENNLSDKVTLLGLVPNTVVGEWLRASDLFVLSSDYEGMPMCVIEAMGCGVPTATTDVGEVRRLVFPGRNGEITQEFSAKGLAQSMRECLKKLGSL